MTLLSNREGKILVSTATIILLLFASAGLMALFNLQPVHATGTETITNGDFENGLTGWSNPGSWVSIVSPGFNSSSNAAKIPAGGHAGTSQGFTTVNWYDVDSFGFYYKTSGSGDYGGLCAVSYSDGSSYQGVLTAANDWTYKNLNAVITGNIVGVSFWAFGPQNTYVDAVSLVTSPHVLVSLTPIGLPSGWSSSAIYGVTVNGGSPFSYTYEWNGDTFNLYLSVGTYTLIETAPVIAVSSSYAYTFQNWVVNGVPTNDSSPLSIDVTGPTAIALVYTGGLMVGIVGTVDVTSPDIATSVYVNNALQATPYNEWSFGGPYNFTISENIISLPGGTYGYTFQNWLVNGVDSGSATTLITTITGNTTIVLNYTGAVLDFASRWLVGGNGVGMPGAINLAKVNETAKIDLTGDVPNAELDGLERGFGYYLIGSWVLHSGAYDPGNYSYGDPYLVGRVTKFDGANYTTIINDAQGLQINAITKGATLFFISGQYTSYGGDYPRGRLYSYDGTTLTDLTTTAFGGTLSTLNIESMCNLGNNWLFGIHDSSAGIYSLYKFDGENLTSVATVSAPITTMAQNGNYALLGSNSSNYLYAYLANGTLVNLTSTINLPVDSTISDIVWGNSKFMLTCPGATSPQVLSFDGTNWITEGTTHNFNVEAWSGEYWLFGGPTGLWMLNGTTWTDMTSIVSFDVTGIAAPLTTINVHVETAPNQPTAVNFDGTIYITPTDITVSIAGNKIFAAPPHITHSGQTYDFNSTHYFAQTNSATLTQASSTVPIISDTSMIVYYVLAPAPTPTPHPIIIPTPTPEPHTPPHELPWWLTIWGLLAWWMWLLLIAIIIVTVAIVESRRRN